MRNFDRTLWAAVAALTLAVTAGPAAAAQGYTGSWPATVTHSKGSDGTYCVMLTDGGSGGWPHSGQARLVTRSQTLYGTFQLINHELVATFEASGYGQNAGLVFAAHASHGSIGKGFYDEVYGGEEFDSGALEFGNKGGC